VWISSACSTSTRLYPRHQEMEMQDAVILALSLSPSIIPRFPVILPEIGARISASSIAETPHCDLSDFSVPLCPRLILPPAQASFLIQVTRFATPGILKRKPHPPKLPCSMEVTFLPLQLPLAVCCPLWYAFFFFSRTSFCYLQVHV